MPRRSGSGEPEGAENLKALRPFRTASLFTKCPGRVTLGLGTASGAEDLVRLNGARKLHRTRAVIDNSHIRALKGGPKRKGARSTEVGRAPGTTS